MKSQSNVKETKSGVMACVKYTLLVDSILSKMCKCFGMFTFLHGEKIQTNIISISSYQKLHLMPSMIDLVNEMPHLSYKMKCNSW